VRALAAELRRLRGDGRAIGAVQRWCDAHACEAAEPEGT
jgi:hypothetical protein